MSQDQTTQASLQNPAAGVDMSAAPRRSLRWRLVTASMLVPLATGAAVVLGLWHPDLAALAQTRPAARPVSTPGTAQVPTLAVTSGTPTSNTVSVLMERANFWRNQTQYDQALESLTRALDLEPRNADALALMAQIQAERGNTTASQAALQKLRQASPSDPRIDKIDQAIKVGPIPQEALADARRLAREGRLSEAVDRYNRVFRGNPPPDRLAVEFYQTVAGTEGGWETARDGLARVVRENPQDVRAQLAYAQILTYRDGARTDGVQRLALLAKNPAVADSAGTAWRQALNWLPMDQTAIGPLTEYLAVHPNDAEVQAKLDAARNPPADPNDPAAKQRITGFDQLNANRLNDAAAAFQTAIDANPNDADAIGGLGLVRLRQRRLDEARTLLNRAIALDPSNRGRWQPALTGVAQAVAGSQPNPATTMMDRGNFPGAEAELQRQLARGGGDTVALTAMMADAQARQGKLPAAAASYRAALARNPNFAPALVGLAGILGQQGNHDEAISLLRRAEQTGGDRRLVGQARALQLREQAQTITDPATQAGLFREAMAADPSNPWIALDYGRSLVRQGQVREGRAVMARVVSGSSSIEALKAGIVFANETSDPDAASALLARVPPAQRTADMRQIYANAALQREIGQVIDLPRVTARQRLLAMAARPDPDGARGAAIARALSAIGDSASARRAIVIARDATPNQSSAARIAYAGALLDIGDATGAQIMLSPLRTGAGLPADQRASFNQLRAGLAIRLADDLNQAGRQAEAYDRLAPAIAADPDNPELNLALARLHSGARQPRSALEINQAVLERDPSNADARRGAVAAALQSGNRRLAEQLVAEGLELSPDDPKAWMASADVARAAGNNGRALRDLTRARELRLQQLGYSDNGADDSTLAHVTLQPGEPGINLRTRPQVKVAALGSGQLPNSKTYTYAGADHGQDVIPQLAIPPGLGTAPLPTPLRQLPQAAPAPLQAAPLPAPAPIRAPAPAPAPVYDTGPFGDANAGPVPNRLLDTSNARSLPAPARPLPPPAPLPSFSTGAATTEQLNAQQLNNFGQPSYAAPGAPAVTYAQAPYTTPGYATPQSPYTAPSYPAPQPGYVQPQYVQQQYAAPSYPAYVPPGVQFQPTAAVQPQIPQQLRYQPQAQEYLPQYRPAPPPTAGQAAASDDSLLLRNDDFNKPYRPALPQASTGATPPFGKSDLDQASGFYDNPFRRTPDAALRSSAGLRPGNGTTGPDPVTQEIDRNIIQLRDSIAPTVQAGFGFRARSGDPGLDKLLEVTTPLEATYSPGGVGQLRLGVTPTILNSGSISQTGTNIQRFGTSVFGLSQPVQGPPYVASVYTGAAPNAQNAQGVGVNLGYTNRWFAGDVGTTPIGFKIQNIVGGIELSPQLTDALRLRFTAERRAVTDSLLSYAGTTDPRTNSTWGGVVRNRFKAGAEFSAGLANFYVQGGGAQINGKNVTSNTSTEFGAGGSYPIYREGNDEIRVGVDISYLNYSKNLSYFTYGQGGYFSPQNFISAMIPVTYRSKVDEDFNYEVGAALGIQSFSQNKSLYFPNNASLQTQVNAITGFSGLSTYYPTKSQSGIAAALHGKFEYRVSPSLFLGGSFGYQNIGQFNEVVGNLFARYVFNGTSPR